MDTEKTVTVGSIRVTFTRETVLTDAVNRAMIIRASEIYRSLAAKYELPEEAMDVALSKYIDFASQVKSAEGFTFYKAGQPKETLEVCFAEYAALSPRVTREWQKAISELDASWNEYEFTPNPQELSAEKK